MVMPSQTVSYLVTIPLTILLVFTLFIIPLNNLTIMSNDSERKMVGYGMRQIQNYMDVKITSVVGTTVTINITNLGVDTIWLDTLRGYEKTSVVISYVSQSGWVTQKLQYTMIEVGVVNTGELFDPNTHTWISPGEYAIISVTLPSNPIPNTPLQVSVFSDLGVIGSDSITV